MSAEETLRTWQSEALAIRARAARETGVATPAQLAAGSGQQFFEAMFAGAVPLPPIGETLDFLPVLIEPGRAIFQGRPGRRAYNPLGTMHGGWYATLLDSALACSVHASLPAGRGYTTLELKINLVRALTEDVPLVRAEGTLVHLGRQTATAQARVYGPDGKLYAHGSTTCLVFDLPPPA